MSKLSDVAYIRRDGLDECGVLFNKPKYLIYCLSEADVYCDEKFQCNANQGFFMSFNALLKKKRDISTVELGAAIDPSGVISDFSKTFLPAEYNSNIGVAFLDLRALLKKTLQFLPDSVVDAYHSKDEQSVVFISFQDLLGGLLKPSEEFDENVFQFVPKSAVSLFTGSVVSTTAVTAAAPAVPALPSSSSSASASAAPLALLPPASPIVDYDHDERIEDSDSDDTDSDEPRPHANHTSPEQTTHAPVVTPAVADPELPREADLADIILQYQEDQRSGVVKKHWNTRNDVRQLIGDIKPLLKRLGWGNHFVPFKNTKISAWFHPWVMQKCWEETGHKGSTFISHNHRISMRVEGVIREGMDYFCSYEDDSGLKALIQHLSRFGPFDRFRYDDIRTSEAFLDKWRAALGFTNIVSPTHVTTPTSVAAPPVVIVLPDTPMQLAMDGEVDQCAASAAGGSSSSSSSEASRTLGLKRKSESVSV